MASICCSPPLSVPATWLGRSSSRGNRAKTRVDALLDGGLVADDEGAHLEVLEHGQAGEHPAALGDLDHALGRDLVGRVAAEVLAGQRDRGHCAGRTSPLIVLRVVLLPAPLPPIRVTISPSVDVERDPLEGMDVAVVACGRRRRRGAAICHQAAPVGGAAGSRRRRLGGAAPRPKRPAAEVGLDHPRVALDLARRALGDLQPVVEDGDPLRDAHHDPHLVLDEQDGDAQLAAQAPDELGHLQRLGRVHARRRLVEEQQPGLAGQRPGHLEAPLVAVRAA